MERRAIDYGAQRRNMVLSQLRPNRVRDEAILDAFAAVPRERFVPEHLRSTAYVDEDLPLGGGRFLMQPMVLARLLQLAELQAANLVLDVGCGTGYSAAILARLAATVVAVEQDAALAKTASRLLSELGADNVLVVEAPLAGGWAQQAPYDVVLIDGGVASVPPLLLGQVAEGGRLVTVLRQEGIGGAVLMRRIGGTLSHRMAFDAAVPVLPGFEAEPQFVF